MSRRCEDQLAVINMTLDMAHFGSLVDKQGPRQSIRLTSLERNEHTTEGSVADAADTTVSILSLEDSNLFR